MSFNRFALSENIRHYRKKRGLTQESLSEKIGKTPTFLSYIESGIRGISVESLVDIANALNVTVDMLLKESLETSALVMNNEFAAVLGDCTGYEQAILKEVLVTVKTTIRDNRELFYQCYRRR